MRLLQKYLSAIFLTIFISLSVVVPQTHAVDLPFFPGVPGVTQPKTSQDYLKEFCDKRSGDLMNLETWYSGKCSEDVDTLSGEGVGFVDIIILQGMEWLNGGPVYDSFLDHIVKIFKLLQGVKDSPLLGEAKYEQLNAVFANNGGGLVPSLANLTGKLLITKPASSVDYVSYVASNLQKNHIVSEAFAVGPGYGFTSLSPILPLWRAFRNVAYLLFAFGFVIYGIMIMFRVRIDAKTAATIQLAIPRLIGTLIMITFSYAIVGLLIDLSTVVSALMMNILRAGGILTMDKNWLPIIAGGQSAIGAVGSLLLNFLVANVMAPFIFFNLLIGGMIGIVVGVVASGVGIVSGLGIVISAVLLLAVGYGYFKLIMKLFQAYLSIIISLIFAPVILLGNLLPGSDSFGSWLRGIYGNLAVFPVASFFLTLSYALMVQPVLSVLGLLEKFIEFGGTEGLSRLLGVKLFSSTNTLWSPPMTTPNWGEGGLVGNVGSLMLAAIGIGLLLMASKYVEMVEKALKVPPFPYGAAIGEALKYGAGGNEAWARKGYAGLPGFLGRGARRAYPGSASTEPTVQIGGTDTGINIGKVASGK